MRDDGIINFSDADAATLAEAVETVRKADADIAAAHRLADRTMQRRMSAAAQIVDDYPQTHAALTAGRIQLSHARVIVDAGANLPENRRAAFERGALIVCETESVGRARARVEILAERQHPTTLTERHAIAREGRRVFTTPLPHSMSEIVSVQPAVIADAIHDRLTRHRP